jgi:uncharacterized membrane protein
MRERMFQSIQTEYDSAAVNEWALLLVAAVPYIVGWFVGFVVRLVVWLIAAVVAGYHAGRGEAKE